MLLIDLQIMSQSQPTNSILHSHTHTQTHAHSNAWWENWIGHETKTYRNNKCAPRVAQCTERHKWNFSYKLQKICRELEVDIIWVCPFTHIAHYRRLSVSHAFSPPGKTLIYARSSAFNRQDMMQKQYLFPNQISKENPAAVRFIHLAFPI